MSKKFNSIRICLVLLLALALMGVVQPVGAQEVTAAITGSVADPSGAPIVGANVTAIDTARGVTYPTKTNEQGIYNIQRIPIGEYKIEIEAKGFQKLIRPPFKLVLNQTARVDVQMKIGQTTEVVEVSATAPLLQTDTTQLSTVIDSKTNETLPLATRNYVQLTMLTPGAVNPDPASFVTGQDMTTQGRPYINGNRQQENNFMLDGMDNNQLGDNEVGYSPSVDAIQEFNLISQNASAEFGNFMGGTVSTSIKSGTNKFHGNVYEFFRNDVLNANSWQNGLHGYGTPKLRWNLFGATFGGPIVKNKVFFFMDYEGQRQDHPGSATSINIIPTNVRNGDLSYLCTSGFVNGICQDLGKDANGVPIPGKYIHQLYNRVSTPGTITPFLNNQIPTSMFSPVATALFASKYYAAPSDPNYNSNGNFTNINSQQYNRDQGDLKIDYNISEKDRVFGRWSQMYLTEPITDSWALTNENGGQATEEKAKNFVVNWTHTFGPTIMNEFRTGFNWVGFGNSNTVNGLGSLASSIGIGNAGAGFPWLQIGSGYSDIGNVGKLQNFGDTTIQLGDTVIITKGRHTFHTGFQFNRYRMNSAYAGNSGLWGTITFGGGFTSDATGTGGASVADFLLGLPFSTARGGAQGWGQRSNMIGGFLQDDYRITDELTLNLGLRYETHTPWVEKNNHQVNFGEFTGDIMFAGKNGNSDALYHAYNGITNFQPRIGFAYSPKALHNKTVFRGAYALSSYAESMGSNNRLPQNIPFVPAETSAQYSSNGTALPGTTLSDGFLPSQGAIDPSSVTPASYAGAAIRMWDPNWRPAVSQQWNFSVQHQLTNSTTVQVGYVGQHNTHLTNFYWANQKILNADGTTSPGPYAGPVGTGGVKTLKDYIGAIRMTLSNGNSKYHAMQAILDQRFSKGLQGQLSYTLSNCKTDAVGFYGNWSASQTSIGMPSPQDIFNPKADWGNCNFDVKNMLTGYLNYALPFGKGKQYGGSMNRWADLVAGGWEVSAIYTYHTGFAMNFVDGWVDPAGTGSFMERPNVVGKITYPKKTVPGLGIQWVDPSAFAIASPGHFGNEPIGDLRGPGENNVDLSVHKSFPFGESRRVEFRAEAMNVFNHPLLYFGAANLYLNQGAQSGVINQSRNERNIQLALKIYF